MGEFTITEIEMDRGALGLSPLPGRWSLQDDFRAIADWKPTVVISMTTLAEMQRHGVADIETQLAGIGARWLHLPIEDFGAPTDDILARWPVLSKDLCEQIGAGARVLVHCFGGCGRSGMVVLRLMVDSGEAAEAALDRLRAARPCAVETDAQMAWAKAT
jgi:protein-tyrosine phosphatase